MEFRVDADQILTKLNLQNYKSQIGLVISEIESKHKIEIAESLLRTCGEHSKFIEMQKQTFVWSHHPKCGSILVVNPNPIALLEGDNKNWIWGLIHELGHQRDPTSPFSGDSEKREMKAWENASLIFDELRFDKELKEGFRKRAIYALNQYSRTQSWKRKYSWSQCGHKIVSSSCG